MEENQQIEPSPNNKDERTWAMLCHLSALAGFLMPMGNVIGPLIVWLIKKDEMPLVAEHGIKSLNFQITMLIAYIVCFFLMLLVVGIFLLPVVAIFSLVMVIVATVKANDGQAFDYPFSLHLIK